MLTILGLCGSLRPASHNRRLLSAAAPHLPAGARLEIFNGLAGIPPYSEHVVATEPVHALRAAFHASDAVLITTPEYNGSMPGQLKNALDWASRPHPNNSLRDKPAAVAGASTGLFGAVWAQADLRRVLKTIGARVVEAELPVGQADDAFDSDGRLRDADLQSALADLVAKLIDEVPKSTAPFGDVS